MTPRAVIYLRVSTSRQVDGASLETQELMCQNWATTNGIIISRIFHDDGVSAKTMNRPSFNEMMTYLEENKGKVAYLVTYQTDRLSRNMEDFVLLRARLKKLGIEYKNTNSRAELNTPSDILVQNIEAAMAQHENQVKSERVTENMRKHALEGYRMSKAPEFKGRPQSCHSGSCGRCCR